jgi:hypothetical protein
MRELLGYCGAPQIGYTAQLLHYDLTSLEKVSVLTLSEMCKKCSVIYKFKLVHKDSA